MTLFSVKPKERPAPTITWSRGDCLSLALTSCTTCCGLGQVVVGGAEKACQCVRRQVFRNVLREVRNMRRNGVRSRVIAAHIEDATGNTHRSFGNKGVEFVSDFDIVARRALTSQQLTIIQLMRGMSLSWQEASAEIAKGSQGRVVLERAEIMYLLYRAEAELGTALYECRPYALWPVSEYMSGRRKNVNGMVA